MKSPTTIFGDRGDVHITDPSIQSSGSKLIPDEPHIRIGLETSIDPSGIPGLSAAAAMHPAKCSAVHPETAKSRDVKYALERG
jgi:hypothetical protein